MWLHGSWRVRDEAVSLRRYRPTDLDALHALDCLCFAPMFRFSKGAIRRFATAADAETWVAETLAREIAGFVIVEVLPPASATPLGYVVTLDVLPTMLRRGIGTSLLRKAEEAAAERGAQVMELHVHTGNTQAIGLYEACGYCRVGEAKNFYGKELDARVYRRSLLSLREE